MLAQRIQTLFEEMYRIDRAADVSAFRISEEQSLPLLRPGAREALLVRQDGEHTDLALFLSEELMASAKPFVEGSAEALDAFCAVAEGVSHFVYFTFCGAQMERPVSQFELELQAEIDKYLLLRTTHASDELLHRLFERFELDETLSSEQRERYRLANRAARRYARWLESKARQGKLSQALEDARRVYRMPLRRKLERIARAA